MQRAKLIRERCATEVEFRLEMYELGFQKGEQDGGPNVEAWRKENKWDSEIE
jgi:hypothetical protein